MIGVDARNLGSSVGMEKLETFFRRVYQGTRQIKIIVVCPAGQDISFVGEWMERCVKLAPLEFRASAILFGNLFQHVTEKLCAVVRTADELADLLIPDAQADARTASNSMSKRCRDIFSLIGEGIPSKIRKEAKQMTAETYSHLIRIGKQPELTLNIKSRYELETEIASIKKRKSPALASFNYLQAQDLQYRLEELKQLQGQFPAVDELMTTQAALRAELDSAVANDVICSCQRYSPADQGC